MQRKQSRNSLIYFALIGAGLVGYAAIRAAPYWDKGIIYIMSNFETVFFGTEMVFTDNSFKFIFIAELIYALSVIYYVSSRKNRRRGE